MVIEIRGTQTGNKGAQLMLEAIVERCGDSYRLSAPPIMSDYDIRARLGLRQTLHAYKYPRATNAIANRIPRKLTTRYGLTRDRDITAVLDASGFAYGDTFGAARSKREALYGRAWKRRGVPRILLPQAFGPFTDPQTRRWARETLDQATLIFARDEVSAGHLEDLGVSTEIVLSPDFTIAVSPMDVTPIDEPDYFAVVPNAMMISTGAIEEAAYVDSLAKYVAAARATGLAPVIVAHETGDLRLSKAVAAQESAPIFHSPEPRVLKAALGKASGIVSSRFHAVVGGLSQSRPTLAYGWSHKYHELLRDFGVPQWMVAATDDPSERVSALLTDMAGKQELTKRRDDLVAQVDAMWAKTFAHLPNSPLSTS